MYMHEIGHGPAEMWAMLSGTMKEIVGVGATAGMGDVGRRHFDLMACACAQQIADSLISEFEVMNDMVPVCVGPFIGRLFRWLQGITFRAQT